MKNTLLKAAACVPEVKPADVKWNTARIISMIRENRDCGLLVFPELSVCGYTVGDLIVSEVLISEAEKAVREIAAETKGLTAVVGVPVLDGNTLYNCAAVLSDGEVRALIPKTSIPSYGEFAEGRWFASGKDVRDRVIVYAGNAAAFGSDLIIEDPVYGIKAGCEIGEDLWTADAAGIQACLAGAEVIFSPAASDELIGRAEFRRKLIETRSASCSCGYVYASAGVNESTTDLVFSGHALIAENGHLLNESVWTLEDSALKAVIDVQMIRHNRTRKNTSAGKNAYRIVPVCMPCAEQKPEISADEMAEALKQSGRVISRMPFIPADPQELTERCRTILQIQAHGLARRVRSIGIRTLVIGISGGLDSTLALLVCGEAKKIVPDIRIIAVTMPSEGNTSSRTYQNAVALMESLGAEIREVPIRRGVESHLEDIGHGKEYQGEGDVTYENAQARMRTYILMDIANMENGLVVGTGDLSELALGWCTYNGDHMAMYGVNASVPKTLVRYLCTNYGDRCGDEKLKEVLYSVAETPITPELTPSKDGQFAQKTEEKIGKYDLNDFFLYYYVRWGFAPERILAWTMAAYPEIDKTTLKDAESRFFRRFFTQQFKRSCLPDGPKVGSVGLSPRGDWHMPSDASAALWLENLENA